MFVGLCTLTLRIPQARSLKDKRSVVQSVLARVRARFNVSVSEVAAQDRHKDAVLAVAAVGSSQTVVSDLIEQVARFIGDGFPAELIDYTVEIL